MGQKMKGDALTWLVGQNLVKKVIFEMRSILSCPVALLDIGYENCVTGRMGSGKSTTLVRVWEVSTEQAKNAEGLERKMLE